MAAVNTKERELRASKLRVLSNELSFLLWNKKSKEYLVSELGQLEPNNPSQMYLLGKARTKALATRYNGLEALTTWIRITYKFDNWQIIRYE